MTDTSFFRQNFVRPMESFKSVPVVEFCESSDYCNKPLFPKQRVMLKLWFLEDMEGWEEDVLSGWIRGENGVVISPMVRERRAWLKERGYKHFGEIILNGGRRGSKGYMTGAAVAKKIYETSQIPDPGRYYAIDPDKQILFSVVAAKEEQARDMQFADIESWVKRCRPLQNAIPSYLANSFSVRTDADAEYIRDMEARGISVASNWSRLACKPLPARSSTLRGSTSMVVVFDEFAHMLGTEGSAAGDRCYEAAVPALRQFGRDGLVFANSSPYTEIGQFFLLYEQALAMNGAEPADMEKLYVNFPSWEIYSDWRKYPHPKFTREQINHGALMVAPESPDLVEDATGKMVELTDDEKAVREKARNDERNNPDSFLVEYRARWAKVEEPYLKSHVVDIAFSPVFEIVNMEPPFVKEIRESLKGSHSFSFKGHCDPSSTTAGFGFAVGHVEIWPDPFHPERFVNHVVFDIVHRWNPADFPEHTIDHEDVQNDLLQYNRIFHMDELTFDQYQSVGMIQWLRRKFRDMNMSTKTYERTATNDVNWKRWEVTKTAFNLNRVHIPPDCRYARYAADELKFLQKKATSGRVPRVDKQDVGPMQTKDIADCICEVTAHLIGDEMAILMGDLTQPIVSGAEKGYRIGGHEPGGPMGGSGMSSGSFEEYYQSGAAKRGENTNPLRGVTRRKRY